MEGPAAVPGDQALTWYFLIGGRDLNPRPAGFADSAFYLPLSGDAFGAGEVR